MLQSAFLLRHYCQSCPVTRYRRTLGWKKFLKDNRSLNLLEHCTFEGRSRNSKSKRVERKSRLLYKEIPSYPNTRTFNYHQGRRKDLQEICDLRKPTEWYPGARSMKRSIIFHAGPTNSGKTHSALEQFLSSASGIYCCPLRLLAREVAQNANKAKVACNLVTGEEKDLAPGRNHMACTVEMANLSQTFDIGVIDEIQIIANANRGWAWTQALLGLKAKHIHVCGEARAIEIVERLSADCGDDFQVLEYKRLTKLRVKKNAVGSITNLRSGDCVVCFRRSDIYKTIFQLKKIGKDPAVIYGKLPPSTKRMEAQKFNNPDNPCDILVATDAIGMGLNLNIKRIVFQSMSKGVRNDFGIIENTKLTTPDALQIAGRAGRFGLQESGEVTTLHDKDIKYLHHLLSNPLENIKYAHILPTKWHLQNFSAYENNFNLFNVLTNFRKFSRLNKKVYILSSQRDCLDLAEAMQRFELSLSEAYTFSLCPVNTDSDISMGVFCEFVKTYCQSRPVTIDLFLKILRERFHIKIPLLPEIEYKKIALLEDVHNTIGVYLWLAQKFPKSFPDRTKMIQLQRTTVNTISDSLYNVRYKKTTSQKRLFKLRMKKLRQKLKPRITYH